MASWPGIIFTKSQQYVNSKEAYLQGSTSANLEL
jgi:hypothetical protein